MTAGSHARARGRGPDGGPRPGEVPTPEHPQGSEPPGQPGGPDGPGGPCAADDAAGPRRPARRRLSLWAAATVLALAAAGAVFSVSYHNNDDQGLAPQRYVDLASLVRNESRRVERKTTEVDSLQADVRRLTEAVDDRRVKDLRRRADQLKARAGMTEVTGPAVTVTLSDAPADLINQSEPENLNMMVVHQQDIQAVVNAMWKGGATAVTLQGQRIINTTGIKCQGNSVQIEGIPYAQPYVVTAIGDQTAILQALEYDPYLARYRAQADQPDIAIGWSLATQTTATAPAYAGLVTRMEYAQPLDNS